MNILDDVSLLTCSANRENIGSKATTRNMFTTVTSAKMEMICNEIFKFKNLKIKLILLSLPHLNTHASLASHPKYLTSSYLKLKVSHALFKKSKTE